MVCYLYIKSVPCPQENDIAHASDIWGDILQDGNKVLCSLYHINPPIGLVRRVYGSDWTLQFRNHKERNEFVYFATSRLAHIFSVEKTRREFIYVEQNKL